MNPSASRERAGKVRHLFDVVADLAPAARAARLDQEADPTLRREVEALLDAYGRADAVLRDLEQPTVAFPEAPDRLLGQQVTHYHILTKPGIRSSAAPSRSSFCRRI